MKKIVSLAAFGLAFASLAAPQKLVEVTLNDRSAILTQASKLGDMTGIPMIGLGAVGLLAKNPFAADFGAPRDGAVTTFAVYADPDELNSMEDAETFDKKVRCVVTYPSSKDKAAYGAAKGLVPTNGVYASDGRYVAFSADGKWVTVGNDPTLVTSVLPAAGSARLTRGELVRMDVDRTMYGIFDKVAGFVTKENPESKGCLEAVVAMLNQFDAISVGLRLSDRGFDFLLDVTARPGTEFAKIGLTPLAKADPLAFAGKEAFAAEATAAGCGSSIHRKKCDAFLALAKKYGPDVTLMTIDRTGETMTGTLEMKALIEFIQSGEAGKWFKSLGGNAALEKDIEAFTSEPMPVKAEGPEASNAFCIRGQSLPSTPAMRFAKAFPELKKPFYYVSVASLYAAFYKGAEAALAEIKPEAVSAPEEIEMARDFLKSQPAVNDGCFARVAWREGAQHKIVLRVTPDEVKNISALVKVALSVAGNSTAAEGGVFGEELPDDED